VTSVSFANNDELVERPRSLDLAAFAAMLINGTSQCVE
jgi:hypothetical protein